MDAAGIPAGWYMRPVVHHHPGASGHLGSTEHTPG